jgi:hypothetical protein
MALLRGVVIDAEDIWCVGASATDVAAKGTAHRHYMSEVGHSTRQLLRDGRTHRIVGGLRIQRTDFRVSDTARGRHTISG